MRSVFMFYVVLLLVSFSVLHTNHAHEENDAIQERALINRINYNVTLNRKLLLLPDIGDNDGNNGAANDGDVGGDDGTGNDGDVGIGGDGNGGDYGAGDDGTGGDGSSNRIGPGSCSKESIHVNQGATAPLPSGIPTYTAIVENLCFAPDCSISNIHLGCGWFSSARLINPKIFRRLAFNDCLVNDGQPLTPGQSLTFIYANTYKYDLNVSSVQC